MRLYRLLVVDDEPHVVDAVVSLLENQADLSIDVYSAYSGKEAIEIMKMGKIDLLITDIQMPDMTGIKLVDSVNQMWPLCKTIFLTAHSDFNYAYEAIRKQVVCYILKSEDDDLIIKEVKKTLALIEYELNQQEALILTGLSSNRKALPVSRNLFFHLLTYRSIQPEQKQSLFSLLGFHEPIDSIHIIYGVRQTDTNRDLNNSRDYDSNELFTIRNIFNYYMNRYLSYTVCEADEYGNLIWIIQFKPTDFIDRPEILLSGTLETVQSSCFFTTNINISFLLSMPIQDLCQVPLIYNRIKYRALKKTNEDASYVLTCIHNQELIEPIQSEQSNVDPLDNTIQFIKEYIDSNITGDVSLMKLSVVTGYNDTYLSNIFHKQTGEMLHKYITRKKIIFIENLLKDTSMTIESVADHAGFNSRSYFNRFVKNLTGMTPKKYRLKLLNSEQGAEK